MKHTTVPLKGTLTVSTPFSKLDSHVAKVETFKFRDARIESWESRVEDRESRNAEFWNIHELRFVQESAIHLSKKDNNHVTQFSVVVHVHSMYRWALFVTLIIGVMDRKEDLTGIETSRVKTKQTWIPHLCWNFVIWNTNCFCLYRNQRGKWEDSNKHRTTVETWSIWYIQTWKSWFACFKGLLNFFFLIHIHNVHEMTPFIHQDAIKKSLNIRKWKRTDWKLPTGQRMHFLSSVTTIWSPSV